MAFTRDWDESVPNNDTYAHQIDDYNRYLREDLSDRLDILFYGLIAGENSYDPHAKMMQFRDQASVATPGASYGRLYVKDVSGNSELFYQAADGNEKQLTNGGKLNVVSADIPNDEIDETDIRLTNNAFLTARNNGDDGDVNLIKANASDAVEIPDGAQLASGAAPTADAQISNKKYVDDQIAARFGQSSTVEGTTDISPGSGWADMTTMSRTITTTGGNVLVLFTGTLICTSSTDFELRFDFDGSPYCTQLIEVDAETTDTIATMHYLFTSVSAASHTWKVQWRYTIGGSGAEQPGTSYPRILTVMELPS